MKILQKTSVISTLLLSMTTFSFAQDKYSVDDVKGSIVFYTHWTNMIENGDMAKWVDTFKKKYPNVEDIQVQGIGRYASTMSTRLATGDYGDVMEVTAQTLPNSELGDFFLPLNDMNLSKDMYFPDQWGYEGKEYAYTYGVNIEAVVYNKAAFAKAGITNIPTTRTQLFADAEKLKATGTIPFVSNMGTGWALVAYDGLAAAISGSNDFAGDLMKDKTPFSATQPYGQSFGVLREFIDRDLTESDLTTDNWNKSRGWMA
ncbi:MAG: ABC transporter substrate-binding protein, partial [Gammaproteobacteria bacterium]|nr:ABC transporter substrate-binding protein [Gammaproteobacteria bacterium]